MNFRRNQTFVYRKGVRQLNMNHHYAFTLAEVLITLGIIGVVSALTIPSLIQNYQEQATVGKLRKMYNTLSNAYNIITIDDDPSGWKNTIDEKSATEIYKKFAPHLKIIKDCNTQDNSCFPARYTKKNGDDHGIYYSNYYKVILNDGASIMFRAGGDSTKKFYANIFYDIKGDAKPNRWGHDLFEFLIIGNKLLPGGSLKNQEEEDQCLSSNANGYACAKWAIEKGNLDYLHCDNLTWNGKDKCSK